MPMPPALTIILPIYNTPPRFLRRCLDSLLVQTFEDWEAVLASDGPEECDAVCREYAARDARFRLTEKSGSYGKAVNRGIDEARGGYIGIVEADDWCDPRMFRKLMAEAERTGADVVKTGFREAYDNPRLNRKKKLPYAGRISARANPTFFTLHPSIWCAVYRLAFLREKGIRLIEDRISYVDCAFHFETFALARDYRILHDHLYYYYQENPGQSIKRQDNPLDELVVLDKALRRLRSFPDVFEEIREYLVLAFAANLHGNYERLDCQGKATFWHEAHRVLPTWNFSGVYFDRLPPDLLRFMLALYAHPDLPDCVEGQKSLPPFPGGRRVERFALKLWNIPVAGIRLRGQHGTFTFAGLPLVRWQHNDVEWSIRLFGLIPLFRLSGVAKKSSTTNKGENKEVMPK